MSDGGSVVADEGDDSRMEVDELDEVIVKVGDDLLVESGLS